MSKAASRHTLNRKLLRIVLLVFVCVAASTMTVVTWLSTQSESRRLAEMEAQVRANIASKAHVLVDNHALALRGMVADNAFTDVRQIVERAVEGDPDLIYGVFVAADGTPWAYASPTTKALSTVPGLVGYRAVDYAKVTGLQAASASGTPRPVGSGMHTPELMFRGKTRRSQVLCESATSSRQIQSRKIQLTATSCRRRSP